jgi:hypothetical protein
VRPQAVVSLIGIWFLVVGVFGYIAQESEGPGAIILPPAGGVTTQLKVVNGTGDASEASASSLQGTSQLQGQNPSLQTPVGDQLQPNAGAESLPETY